MPRPIAIDEDEVREETYDRVRQTLDEALAELDLPSDNDDTVELIKTR